MAEQVLAYEEVLCTQLVELSVDKEFCTGGCDLRT
jgi:hypothetical protein